MNNIKKAEENQFLQDAEHSAGKAILNQMKTVQLKSRLANITTKYEAVFQQFAGHKVVFLAAIAAHLVAAILAGLNIGPILFSVERQVGQLVSWEDYARILLPILMIFFLSLAIGLMISQVNFRRHELKPRAVRFNPNYLLSSLFALVVYFGLLSHIIAIGVNSAGPEHQLKVQLVLWLSIVELIIGVFAHTGWTIAIAHFKHWNIQRSTRRNQRAYFRNRHNCERNYRYYQQITPPENFIMTPNIEKILGEVSF